MLPFLVVHGPVVWKIALGLFVVTSVVIVRAVVRARERRRIVAALKIRYAGFNEVRAGHVVLRAVFRGTQCTTLSRGEAAIDRCDGPASIELEDGTRVQIEGPIRVLFGTRVRVSPWGGPKRIDEVRDGDLVTARGLAAHDAAVGTGSYRESAGQWTLRADPALDEPLTISSRTPAIRARAMGPALALALVGASAGGYFGLHAVDLHPSPPESSRAETAFPRFGEVAFAAALPGSSRLRALSTIEDALRYEIDRSPARDQMRDEFDDLLALPCAGYHTKARDRLEDARYEAALESARACGGDVYIERRALSALARYDEAFAISKEIADETDAQLVLVSAIATGRSDVAAVADVAKHWAVDPYKAAYYCLSSWLAREELDKDCKPEAGYEVAADEPFQFRLMVGPPRANSWLVQFVPPSDLDDPKRMDLVATAIVRGDFDAATSAAASIQSSDLAKLAKRAIELRTGAAPLPVDESWNAEPSEIVDMSWERPHDEGCGLLDAITRATRDGDGGPIAAVLRRHACTLYQELPVVDRLFAVLPHITKGRDEIADALRRQPGIYETDPGPPMRAAVASLRRDLARNVGDRTEVERQAAIIKRAVGALGSRERVLAFRELGL